MTYSLPQKRQIITHKDHITYTKEDIHTDFTAKPMSKGSQSLYGINPFLLF